MRRLLGSDRGFALPITIFVITIITLMLAAILVRVQLDRRLAESSADMADALAIAQSGLQRYVQYPQYPTLDPSASLPSDGDSVRINLSGGWADVVARRARVPADSLHPWLYLIRSTGHVLSPIQGPDTLAARTVAQYAWWQPGIRPVAAYTAANQLFRRSGGDVFIDGDDEPACGTLDTLGVRTREFSTVDNALAGETAIGGTGPYVAGLTRIDWQKLRGGTFVPDYTGFQANDDSYPSIRLTGNARLWGSGYGLLIVTGDLWLDEPSNYDDSFIWNGVILVGGKIDFDTHFTWIYGSVVSGLNELLGGPTSTGNVGGLEGTNPRLLTIHYCSREIRRAVTGFVPISNAWVDNWATY
jgi:hypothetical protein